jgi:hypothetical protein
MYLSRRAALAVLTLLGVGGGLWQSLRGQDGKAADKLYATPLAPPERPLDIYHLGHSLVGHDMPAMLAQLAPAGHEYAYQIGWGTYLQAHWEQGSSINGYRESNNTSQHRPARQTIGSERYDAIVLTEAVEIQDAIKYHQSAEYLARWADLALSTGTPRIYLYETWHRTDDKSGWLARIDRDFETYWKRKILYPTLALDLPVYLIPGGQVMAALAREIRQGNGVGNLRSRDDLFAKDAEGNSDTIHFNDLGAYLIALTHFAVLYHRNPVGLPRELFKADGTPAQAPSRQAAQLMQEVVRDVVSAMPETGVAPWA